MWLSLPTLLALAATIASATAYPHSHTNNNGTCTASHKHKGSDNVPQNLNFPLRILPLGASITYGQGSWDGNGYRDYVRKLLQQRGAAVHMVGTVHAGKMVDNQCEGHRGARVDQVAAFAQNAVHYQPNLILINAGTNDALQNSTRFPVDHIGHRMDALLTSLFTQIPHTTIILSTLLANGHPKADHLTRETINPAYTEIMRRRQKEGQRIVLVDMYPIVAKKQLVDGTHPNSQGYEAMADAWVEGIEEAAVKGWLGR